jgi:hypothetical protein
MTIDSILNRLPGTNVAPPGGHADNGWFATPAFSKVVELKNDSKK